MSSEEEAAAADEVCASCGNTPVDDVKLKKCDGCDLVKYRNDECQNNHREQHEEECKKRLAEIHDRDLFEQPDESHMGECPICCLPMPLDANKCTFMGCCCKTICDGCNYANQKREYGMGLQPRCAFCREPAPKSVEESDKRCMARIEKNDPLAMVHTGKKRFGEGDYESAFGYWTKAAEMGDAVAHYNLSILYDIGQGVKKDKKKQVYHLEEAAIGGHPEARYYLGLTEACHGRFDRAKKHFIINANLGHEKSLKALRQLHAEGNASKGDYAGALLAYQAAVEATKSAEREEADAYFEAKARARRD